MTKIIQINLHGDFGAENLLSQTAVERDADALIVSEPWRKESGDCRWAYSADRKCAMGTFSHAKVLHTDVGLGIGFVW